MNLLYKITTGLHGFQAQQESFSSSLFSNSWEFLFSRPVLYSARLEKKTRAWGRRPATLLIFKKRDSDTGVFSCELCEIFKSTFLTEHFLGLLLNLTAERLKWEYPRLKVSEKLVNRSGWRLFWALEIMRKIEKHAWRYSYDWKRFSSCVKGFFIGFWNCLIDCSILAIVIGKQVNLVLAKMFRFLLNATDFFETPKWYPGHWHK